MLISFNWLKEFVEIDRTVEEIAETLTMGGIEVESLTGVGASLGDVTTARIRAIVPHPNSEKLTLVTLDQGQTQATVVCGAPNVREGQVVAYCPPGGCLPSGARMEVRVIKGFTSPGMVCSEKELSLGDDESGILELNPSTPIGLALPEALPWIEDTILEVSVTPNRGDCLSVLGVAREIGALTGRAWRLPQFAIEESFVGIRDRVIVEVPDEDLCPRYVVRIVEGTTVGPSPFDIRIRLSRSGVRPISNVVDATNLILLECGQPLHAFDLSALERDRVVVRRCDPGERFTTLDGTERQLPENALMIRDGERSVALAGIMGGLNSEINVSTSSVLIESACFERFGIRRTSKALGLTTEASYRFERGVDPEGTLWAAHRAAYLIQRLAGGHVLADHIDVYPNPIIRQEVRVRPHKVNGLLGLSLETGQMAEYLNRLHVRVDMPTDSSGDMACCAPAWRWDLEREVDMIEEVGRIHGFENIPLSMPSYVSAPDRTRDDHRKLRKVNECMNGCGFTEIITMSFVSKSACGGFVEDGGTERVLELMNPLNEDLAVMRTSLLPGLIAAAKRNINFKSEDLKLYEIGKIFTPLAGSDLPREDLVLSAVALGSRHGSLWHFERGQMDIFGKVDVEQKVDFYDMKGALEALLDLFGAEEVLFEPSSRPFLHPGKSADIFLYDRSIGFLGELAPGMARGHDFHGRVQILEIFLEPLFIRDRKKRVFRSLPRYPYVERDVSLMVETNCSGDKIKHLISRLGHDIIASVNLFDLYRGESIPQGRQSMAFRIRYQAEDRTLTDEEVQEVHSSVVDALQKELGATMRE